MRIQRDFLRCPKIKTRIFSSYLVVFTLILQDIMVLLTKEIQDVENAGSNHRFCLCFERLSRESFSRGYAPGAESALQIGDRHTGRVSLLTAV